MSEIETALDEMVTLIKTIPTTNPPSNRVWAHPGESESISMKALPAVVVSKMNAEPGAWASSSFGEGQHEWEILIAVYIEEGPVIITNKDDITIRAMQNASEWYKLLADLLYQNLTLNGSILMMGDENGKLFDYVTDNIIWDGKQYFGHLFIIPVTQAVIQGVSA
ncbi:MAG: hypothetical protein KAJ19_15575 [Gammaproteobacteria bacterium]|nr:hypothetical protein [Gammaproteobacteria bacterium]